MTIVAEKYDYVIGVDTHARTHTYAIVHAANGACAVTEAFPTTLPRSPGLWRGRSGIPREECWPRSKGPRPTGLG